MFGLDSLQIDPNSYDDASILVRFRPEFRDAIAADGTGTGASILQGTQVGKQLGKVPGLPTSYLVNPEGEVVARQVGPIDAESIEKFIHDYEPEKGHK